MTWENRPDTGWGFPPSFHNSGKNVRLVSEDTEIKEALQILFSTSIRERLHRPEFGCDLKRFMFEPVNRYLAIEIQKIVVETITKFEPRVLIKNVEITESENQAFLLIITIDYIIKSSGKSDTTVYSFSVF